MKEKKMKNKLDDYGTMFKNARIIEENPMGKYKEESLWKKVLKKKNK